MFGAVAAVLAKGFPEGTVDIANASGSVFDVSSPYDSYAGIRIKTDGTVENSSSDAGADWQFDQDWITPAVASGRKTYHVKFDYTGDSLQLSSGIGSWIELDGTKSWALIKSIAGSWSGGGTFSISDDGGITTLDTATFSLSIDNV